jgi:CRISPR-associated endonuclease/helicase Cas3
VAGKAKSCKKRVQPHLKQSMKREPLAHSARNGAPEQTYRDHVGNVCRYAGKFARESTVFSPQWHKVFTAVVDVAAAYHDLGKLDDLFQDILEHNRPNRHDFHHVDAGTAHLLSMKQGEAAIACYSHHLGLPRWAAEKNKANGKLAFRDQSELKGLNQLSWQRTDEYLTRYLEEHHTPFAAVAPSGIARFKQMAGSGLLRRLALSCLVDADHSDTAQHYREERELDGLPLRAAERLAALDCHVAGLAPARPPECERERQRLALRQQVYRTCRERPCPLHERIVSCDSPVGTGKTTAVMAHLLRVASERGLRRAFVVLPYTNIIDQSVEVYRRALVLDGESAESVVAAHHHRVEFQGDDWRDLRQLTQRWDAPIVVTTAVQLFETLAACKTAALRKLHQIPGSAIFVDEAHAAMPASHWPQMWRWLRELCDEWGCHLLLASGSLARFWELSDFVPAHEQRPVPELLEDRIRAEAVAFEDRRVQLRRKVERLPLSGLADFILNQPGPRLVILNTVQSAAVLANHLRHDLKLGLNVEHLSTALCPVDRETTVRRVKERLKGTWKDWVLVATSCVEAGVDFSFRTAFRESCGLVNLLQIAGRVSRSGEYAEADVWDFRHDEEGFLTLHPQFKVSRLVLAQLFDEGQVDPSHCTEALSRELNAGLGQTETAAQAILQAERAADYPEVAKLCRIITADTRTVLANPDLIDRFESRDRSRFPAAREVLKHSVQIWSTRLDAGKLPLKSIGFEDELWAWIGEYDRFLGYMAGVLPLLKAGEAGFEPL